MTRERIGLTMEHPDVALARMTQEWMASLAASVVDSVRSDPNATDEARTLADALAPVATWRIGDTEPPAEAQAAIMMVCEQLAEQGIGIACVALMLQANGPVLIAAGRHVQEHGYRDGQVISGMVAAIGAGSAIARQVRREAGSPIAHLDANQTGDGWDVASTADDAWVKDAEQGPAH